MSTGDVLSTPRNDQADRPAAGRLTITSVTKRYGGLIAVDDVSFSVDDGQIVGVIGPNGAGKTTLFNVLSGFVRPTSGQVLWDGHDVTNLSVAARVRLGMVRTFQTARVFEAMTVRENIAAAHHTAGAGASLFGDLFSTRRSRQANRSAHVEAQRLLVEFGLADVADKTAGELPYGITKRLGIVIAIAAAPRLLMLDEPAAGLNSEEVIVLRDDLFRLRAAGITLLLIEHHMGLVMGVSDHVVVLDAGRTISAGRPDQVAADPAVITAYLGS